MGLIRITAFAAALALIGCASITPPEPQVNLPAPYVDQGVSVTVDGLWKNGYGNVVGVSGLAINVSGRDLALCQITLDILDTSGVKVSSAMAATSGLKAGQKWRFQATFLNPYVVNFRSIEPGQITVIASQQAGQPPRQPQQGQSSSNQLKTTIDQIATEFKEVCAREENKLLLLHSACSPDDITLEQFADKSNLAATDKQAFSKLRSESHGYSIRLATALRTYGGPKGTDLALARERAEALSEKNAIALYEGRISWGDYNKRRKEINDAWRDQLNKTARSP
jgi:hypothetical protein